MTDSLYSAIRILLNFFFNYKDTTLFFFNYKDTTLFFRLIISIRIPSNDEL